MRTKTLITSAVLSIAGAAALQAQVYSVNAVGYINLEIAPGYNMLVNQLNNGDNNVADLFKGHDMLMAVLVLNAETGVYNINNYDPEFEGDEWDDPTMTLDPGVGFWLQNQGDSAFTLTLVGEVPQGTLEIPLASGYNLVGSAVPQAGGIETVLGLPMADGDSLLTHAPTVPSPGPGDKGSYTAYAYDEFGFDPDEPVVEVGQAVFYNNSGDAKTWTRDFSVND